MVGVDIEIGDPLETVVAHRCFDRNAGIVENAKARSTATSRVMKPTYGCERLAVRTVHDGSQRVERAADNMCRGLVDARVCRRVAVIERTVTLPG